MSLPEEDIRMKRDEPTHSELAEVMGVSVETVAELEEVCRSAPANQISFFNSLSKSQSCLIFFINIQFNLFLCYPQIASGLLLLLELLPQSTKFEGKSPYFLL